MLKSKLGLSFSVGLLVSVLSSVALAGQCEVTLDATNNMAFTTKEIAVAKSCKEVSITLKNTGTFAKAIMGHNLVISKKADMQAVIEDGNAAGLAKNYVKENDDRVIAHTIVIGGGETASVKFKLDKVDTKDTYSFFCSFPGHATVMKGVFKLI